MTQLSPNKEFPKQTLQELGGGALTLGEPRGENDWQMVVVYRGLHCPICKTYLAELDGLEADFNALGVDVIAVSGDGEAKTQKMKDEKELGLTLGFGLTVAQMQALGLYVSDPRSPEETDQPFSEPGLFLINGEGNLQMVDTSNAPFARPDLEKIRNGIKFIREKDYPVRGTHEAA
ncbi:MAG: redoxin domain-containing protein [Sulfitobacter sp.]